MYDFKSLSYYDFELLVRDLLQKEFSLTFETFKSGKDQGIDIRYLPTKDRAIIVQCKHYATSGYSSLLNTLRSEISKVTKLQPARYCIATSVPLSAENKSIISHLFTPYCKSDRDIYGYEDLNNLLSKFPDVERQHYKLWLTSTTLLETIIHSGIYAQTRILLEKIHAKAKLYVQNASFFDATNILNEHNYCIISGIPGIGKTFLAEILLLDHIKRGYEPILVRSHIREAFDVLNASRKQVFYYDDFLGQTGWEEKLQKNEEQSILDFIQYAREHKHVRFILTTREYILHRAKIVYEKLHASDFDNAKCIIQLEKYTRINKAHILINHLHFSEISKNYKACLAQSPLLLKIIDHKNYSPRIVEWMSTFKNIRDCQASDYPKLFMDTLNDPTKLWSHAFRNHLSPPSRSLMLIMATFSTGIELDDLKDAFESYRYQETKSFGISISSNELIGSIDETEGTFTRCERDSKDIFVAFHNPSVRDFLEKFISDNLEVLRLLCKSIIYYDQFITLFPQHPTTSAQKRISALLNGNPALLAESILRTVFRNAKTKTIEFKSDGTTQLVASVQNSIEKNVLHSLQIIDSLPINIKKVIISTLFMQINVNIGQGNGNMAEIVKLLLAFKQSNLPKYQLDKLSNSISNRFDEIEDMENLDDALAFGEFYQLRKDFIKESLFEKIQQKIQEEYEYLFDYDITNANDDYEIRSIRKTARQLETQLGVSLYDVFERLDSKEKEINETFDEPSDDYYNNRSKTIIVATDAEITGMFHDFI
ncbi:MAG: restriction endonuclease [Bacteroidales bacterium]|nr:restriction endonuclease [Bacteroidales bacterium]